MDKNNKTMRYIFIIILALLFVLIFPVHVGEDEEPLIRDVPYRTILDYEAGD